MPSRTESCKRISIGKCTFAERVRRVLGPVLIEILMIYLNNFVSSLLVHEQYKIKEKQELCLQLFSLNG